MAENDIEALARQIVKQFYPEMPANYSGRRFQIALTALRSTTAATDSAAKDAEIAAYREVLVKVRDWCCPVLCINCADNRKAIDIALANRGEAGALAKERSE